MSYFHRPESLISVRAEIEADHKSRVVQRLTQLSRFLLPVRFQNGNPPQKPHIDDGYLDKIDAFDAITALDDRVEVPAPSEPGDPALN